MSSQDRVGGGHQVDQCGDRVVRVCCRGRHLGQQLVKQIIEQGGLVRHVAVQSVRRYVQATGQRSHRHRLDPALGQHLPGGDQHGGAGQPRPLTGTSSLIHLENCTPFSYIGHCPIK
jgi:hypothetical protein